MVKRTIYDKNFKKDIQRAINFYSTCLHCERCGHSLQVTRKNKVFCEWCGRYIFRSKGDEFIYRMKEKLK